jgi:hypothetical protein
MPQNPMAATSVPLQYLSQLNNKTRLPLLMQTIMGAYNSLPPERRLDTFNREFSTLKQKIVASMMSAQSQQQQQQQLQPQQQPQQQQPGVAPQVGVAPQA